MNENRAVGFLCFVILSVIAVQQAQAAVITACADQKSGKLRAIEVGQQCAPNESLLTWNQEGPPGPQGIQGPPGPQGTPGPAGPPGAIDFGRIYNRICTDQFFCSCDSGEIVLTGGVACPEATNGIATSAPFREPDSCPELHDCAPGRHWVASCDAAPTGEPEPGPVAPTDIVILCLRP